MRVIIAGSRGITDYELVLDAVEKAGFDITEVVSGTARGVDRLGERFAEDTGVALARFPADWNGPHKKAAGHIRNRKMAEYADALIAIWDGKSSGTSNMINEARKLGLQVYVHSVTM